jgi:hypothetical protein
MEGFGSRSPQNNEGGQKLAENNKKIIVLNIYLEPNLQMSLDKKNE